MSKIVDARGLECPHPVILTKKAMDQGDSEIITTIVNQDIAKENVSRLARNQGYELEIEQNGDEYHINMYKKHGAEATEDKATGGEIAVLVKGDLFGEGDQELGRVLMRSFLYALKEVEADIKTIIFMNRGIFLTVKGSPVLEYLQALEEKGIEILSCGTCLDFYQKTESLSVGSVTNMYSAVEALAGAAKTISI